MSNPFGPPDSTPPDTSHWTTRPAPTPEPSSERPSPPRRRIRLWPLLVAALVALVVLVVVVVLVATGPAPGAHTTAPASDTRSAQPTPSPEPSVATTSPTTTSIDASPLSPEAAEALATLGELAGKGRAPRTGYARSQFGQTWSDDVNVESGHNGCDTRDDILKRDLTGVEFAPGTRDCVVVAGVLNDPYSGRTVDFRRGAESSMVQIDHVVSLSNAWQTGAQALTLDQRTDLANDPRNLQATYGPLNQQKGAGDAATWLPPAKAYRCTYAARQIRVKKTYSLWVTPPERDALARILGGCTRA